MAARAYRSLQALHRSIFSFPTLPPLPESCRQPWLLTRVQAFSLTRKTSRRDPYAWVKKGDNEECPSSQPNKGSVKNRKHTKRMAQRDAFRKEQVQAHIKSCKDAKKRKEEAQRKRWKEGAARARAWAEKQAQKLVDAQQNPASPTEPV